MKTTRTDAGRRDMLYPNVLAKDTPVTVPGISQEHHKHLARRGILDVLDRASQDDRFIAQLTHRGSKALSQYDLTWQERAALLSGDIRWIEAHVGKLKTRQRTWLECRLQQEIW